MQGVQRHIRAGLSVLKIFNIKFMKIPDPRVAKKLTLTGQQRIAEEEEARVRLAADENLRRKRLQRAWMVQSRKLVDQAMSPKNFLQVASVAFPRQLIDSGFEIVEIGDITTHYYGQLPRAQIIQELIDLIPKFSALAPESALRIWKYWEDIETDLRNSIEDYINVPNSRYDPEGFKDYLAKNPNFKKLNLTRFESVICEIQKGIENLRSVKQISNWDIFIFESSDKLLLQVPVGKYFFSKKDNLSDELVPATEGNNFQISWGDGASSLKTLETVVCANGMAWLNSDAGQKLCRDFGGRIESAANLGQSSIAFTVDADILTDEDGFIGIIPSVNFFVELMAQLGYTCSLNKVNNQIIGLEVAW
jgi:hypothetical protein